MDTIVVVLIVVIMIVALQSMFRTNSEPEYVLVPVQRARRGIGCLPFVVGILLGAFVIMLLLYGH